MEGCHWSTQPGSERRSLGEVEEYSGIWGGGTQWKDVTGATSERRSLGEPGGGMQGHLGGGTQGKDVTWWVGVHLGGHFFLIQEYMSSKERMGVMRYSGGYKSTSYLRGDGGLVVGA